MELWIRSQDKKRLTKVEDLYIVHDDNNLCDYIGNNLVGHLAKYTKKERALEVLDEIQNLLQPKVFIKEPKINTDDLIHSMSEYVTIQTTQQVEYDLKQAGQFVYQMPKE